MNVTELNKKLIAMYADHFGTPHSNKSFAEQSKSLKAIATAVGYDNVIKTFDYLLKHEKEWLQPHKNIPGLVRFFDAIQTMRLNDGKMVCASMSQVRRVQCVKEAERLNEYRKELLDE